MQNVITPPEPERIDLRKQVRADLAADLLERARLLPGEDRLLLEGIFREGRSLIQLAQIWRTPRSPTIDARFIQRRVRRITRRLRTPEFAFVASHRHTWPPVMSRVGTACVLHGLTIRQAAEDLQLSIYTVRHNYHAILALCAAHRAGDPQ